MAGGGGFHFPLFVSLSSRPRKYALGDVERMVGGSGSFLASQLSGSWGLLVGGEWL